MSNTTEQWYCHPSAEACVANEGYGCTGHPPRHLEREMSTRGFARYPTIIEPYQAVEVSVYESSAASEAALWLSMRRVDALGDDRLAAHLTLERAEMLADQLRHAIEHHYQAGGSA